MGDKVNLGEGDAVLGIAIDDALSDFTYNISLSHAEFVKRSMGDLPEGGWVGTLRKMDGRVVAFNSQTFFKNQLPAPAWVQKATLAKFE